MLQCNRSHYLMLSNEQVRHIAWLARLGVTDVEVERFREDLSVVLEHFRTLEALDTSTVPAAAHASQLSNVFREDVPQESLSADDVMANAPATQDYCLRVPPILE